MADSPDPKEIRDRFSDYSNEWADIQEQAKIDMRYVAGDPWEPKDRAAREDAGRPCISLDEIGQYLNQYINNLRQTELAIEVTPQGDGANDKDATNRANAIRGIEYKSNAQGAYITAGEAAAERSYGFALIRTGYADDESFDQEIRIQRVANPDMVLLNPNFKEADASDIEDGFYIDTIRRKEFKRKYPKAEITDFQPEHMVDAPNWISEKHVQIAEYWKVNTTLRKLMLVNGPNGPEPAWEDELKANQRDGKGRFKNWKQGIEIIREREVAKKQVVQYLTNGIEVLDEVPWAGTRIPICSCFGKELFFDDGGGAKRQLLSMVRLARDPQMLFAYLATQECEEAGMTPKAPFVGIKGQFESDWDAWENINKIPRGFVQYDQILDGNNGQVVPAPQRPAFQPNFQAYEIAKDSARRSIQAAMGITPLPTAAQRQSEKSGIALEKIQTQESVGSFHFQDNYKRFLHNMGWQINELITPILDTQREIPIAKADGTFDTLHTVGRTSHPLRDDGGYDVQGIPVDPKSNSPVDHLHTDQGNYGVTIKTGPSYQSQREQQSEFVDKLLEEWQQLGIQPPVANKLLAIAIRMKDLGAMGEELATLLDPPDPSNLPPEAQAMIQQLKAQMQQLTQENQALHMDRAARVLEQQTKKEIAGLQEQNKSDINLKKLLVDLIKSELASKSRSTDLIAEQDADAEKQQLGMAHDSAHDLAMEHVKHSHAKEIGAQQAQIAGAQQAGEHAHESRTQTQAQAHERVQQSEAQQHDAQKQTSQQDHEANQAEQAQEETPPQQ